MKKGRFLWSAHRITEKPKAGKARNIKEKQLKNSRNTASKPPAARLSSASAKRQFTLSTKYAKAPGSMASGAFADSVSAVWLLCHAHVLQQLPPSLARPSPAV